MLARCVAAHAAIGVSYIASRKWLASGAVTTFVLEPPLAALVRWNQHRPIDDVV